VSLLDIEKAFPIKGTKGNHENKESVVMKRFKAKNLSIP